MGGYGKRKPKSEIASELRHIPKISLPPVGELAFRF